MDWHTKIAQKAFSIIIFIALIIFSYIGFNAPWGNNYFTDNIVPELIGVCIELLIIIQVFNKWQERTQKKKLITLEKRLREYLIFFLSHNFKDLPKSIRVNKFYSQLHEENNKQIDALIGYIKENNLSTECIFELRTHCIHEASTMEDLLSIASQLTNGHFKAWCRIVYFINRIAHSQDPSHITTYTSNILKHIKNFDTASHEYELYEHDKTKK